MIKPLTPAEVAAVVEKLPKLAISERAFDTWALQCVRALYAAQLARNAAAPAVSYDITPWFSGAQKPWEPGPYQRRLSTIGWAWWNGEHWGAQSTSIAAAYDARDHRFGTQSVPWRGLARSEFERIVMRAQMLAKRAAASGITLDFCITRGAL